MYAELMTLIFLPSFSHILSALNSAGLYSEKDLCFTHWSKEKMMNIRAEVLFCHCECAFSHAALRRLSGMTDTVDAGKEACMHLLKKWTVVCKVNEKRRKKG